MPYDNVCNELMQRLTRDQSREQLLRRSSYVMHPAPPVPAVTKRTEVARQGSLPPPPSINTVRLEAFLEVNED